MKKILLIVSGAALIAALLLVIFRQGAEISPAPESEPGSRTEAPGEPGTPSPEESGQAHSAEEEHPVTPTGIDPLEGKRLTPEEFQELVSEVAGALPTKAGLQKLGEKEAHTMPASMREAARGLGLVAQAVENEPSLSGPAFDFYESCTGNADLSDSVRALCLSNQRNLAPRAGKTVDEARVPPHLKELADRLDY